MNVIVIFDDASVLLAPESIEMSLLDACQNLRLMGQQGLITRIREVGSPDLEDAIGCYTLVVEYSSIIVGSTLTFIS